MFIHFKCHIKGMMQFDLYGKYEARITKMVMLGIFRGLKQTHTNWQPQFPVFVLS